MKILLVGNYEASLQESMQRFAHMLESNFQTTRHQVKLIKPLPKVCKKENSEDGFSKWLSYIDRFLLFKNTLIKEANRVDIVLICDHSNAMYAKWIKNKPVVVTCHDIMAIKSGLGLVESNPTSFSGKLLQKWIYSGLKSCNHIVSVSKNTKNEINDILKITEKRTSVIYNALNYPYEPMELNISFKIISNLLDDFNEKFFFHLGGNQWYKNRLGVINIFEKLILHEKFKDHKLIMAGKPLPQELKIKIKELNMEDKIIELVNLSNKEIQAFYSQAEALIFPSLQEGFGWPIAEAQACGCPVITTEQAPMTEVGGDAAIYINPHNIDNAVKIILENFDNTELSKEKSIANAKRFKTSVMIDAYCNTFLKVMRKSNV